uniref:BTB domain-containing protein n=1 Tax=Aureoumbra lagunensis TaxID=44058 RepID=A0A7S3JRW7_9STRA
MSDEAVLHIRRVAPATVTDEEIREVIRVTGTDKAQLRTKIDEWWQNHRTRQRKDAQQKSFMRTNPVQNSSRLDRNQVPDTALLSTTAFVQWLESRKTASIMKSKRARRHTGLWNRNEGAERVRQPPQGYVPPEIQRKVQLNAQQPWQLRYREHLQLQALALQDVSTLSEYMNHTLEAKSPNQSQKNADLTNETPVQPASTQYCTVTTSMHEVSMGDERIDLPLDLSKESGVMLLPHKAQDDHMLSWTFGVYDNAQQWLLHLLAPENGKVNESSEFFQSKTERIKLSIFEEELTHLHSKNNTEMNSESHIVLIIAPEQHSKFARNIKVHATRSDNVMIEPDFYITKHAYYKMQSNEVIVSDDGDHVSIFFLKEKFAGHQSCTFTLYCRYYHIVWKEFHEIDETQMNIAHKRKLGTDLKSSVVDFADATFHFEKQSNSIRAYRTVLDACSPEIYGLSKITKYHHSEKAKENSCDLDFVLKMSEASQLNLILNQFEPDAIQILMDYFFSGVFEFPATLFQSKKKQLQIITNLLVCAKVLNIHSLINHCEEILCEYVNVDNVASLSQTADKIKSKKLRDAIVKFHLSLAAAPTGILALQLAIPGQLTHDIEETIVESVNMKNVSALLSFADSHDSEAIREACLRFSLENRAAVNNSEFRRLAAKSTLGIDMLRQLATVPTRHL